MKSLRFLDRRAGYSLTAIGLLLGIVAPTALPAFTSADVLTSRSVTLSSAITSATNVSYTTQFTVATGLTTGDGFVVQFCDSASGPLVGEACVEPAGMDLSGATLSSEQIDTGSGFANTTSPGTLTKANETTPGTSNDNYLKWVIGASDSLSAGNKLKIAVTGIKNPSANGTFYARIYTYTSGNFSGFSNSTSLGTYSDNGSVALSTSSTVGVHAYVLESMSFCVSKGDIGDTSNATHISAQAAPSYDCGTHEASCSGTIDPGCVVAPDMTIGQASGANVIALDAGDVSTGGVYAQLSTNAGGGAVVNLKSDATGCGGLYRNGNPANCDIAPKNTTGGIAAGTANFGLTVGSAVAAPKVDGTAGTGTGTIATGTGYGPSDFFINYVDGTSGVTSPYGSELFHSTGTVDNMNVPIKFGATVGTTTPAGSYGANFSMVATGTF